MLLNFDFRWLYIPSINVDGNFELEHLAMKDPLLDVSLSNGEGFMVEDFQYQYHLGLAKDATEVKVHLDILHYCLIPYQASTCSNHQALSMANKSNKPLDATGVGASACARHGFFIPHSVVNFQKGERYVCAPTKQTLPY
jgi:hypothetical protein